MDTFESSDIPILSGAAGAAPSRMNLRRSLSFKKHTSGSEERSSLFASFASKKSSKNLLANSCQPFRVSDLPRAKEGNMKANVSNHSLGELDDSEDDIDSAATGSSKGERDQFATNKHDDAASPQPSNSVNLAGLGAAEMALLLEYDSQEEGGVDVFPNEGGDSTGADNKFADEGAPLNRHRLNSVGDYSLVSTNTSIDEQSVGSAGKELDSVTLLRRLGANPTETELAKVAYTKAQESTNDCFSVGGAGIVDRKKFDEIPSYTKDELLIGQHLGKGGFSDVFEVTVTLRDQQPTERSDATTKISMGTNGDLKDCNGLSDSNNSSNSGRRTSQRRHSMSSSVCVCSLGKQHMDTVRQGKRLTLAMKCLRPHARSNFEHFLVGLEDLIHETTILSSLDHPNIIKLYGRAGDNTSYTLSDGYFILVDRLQETLQHKIDRWAKTYPNSSKNAPSLNQMKVACALSDALLYLHMSDIVFRDLKPANVGFDSCGTLKLFDFGFAISIAPDRCKGNDFETSQEPKLLHDKCGTLRYMAPEVGLSKGYGKEVDVYSFGILMWEICALKKPFCGVKSSEDFENKVFGRGDRPKVGKNWPDHLKQTLQNCWSSLPSERPTMKFVKSMITAAVFDLTSNPAAGNGSRSVGGSLRNSFAVKRRNTSDL